MSRMTPGNSVGEIRFYEALIIQELGYYHRVVSAKAQKWFGTKSLQNLYYNNIFLNIFI